MMVVIVTVMVHESVLLEALPAAKKATVLEHVPAGRMQRPVAPLPRTVGATWELDEAVVEGEVVTERVLPALRVLAVVGKAVHDELVYLAESHYLLLAALDRHSCQCYVRVRGFLIAVRVATWTRHFQGISTTVRNSSSSGVYKITQYFYGFLPK